MSPGKLLDAAWKLDRLLQVGGVLRKNRVYLEMVRDVYRAAARGDYEGVALLDDPPKVPRCHKVRP